MIETRNDFLFGSNGDSIRNLVPLGAMDKETALRTAAWLVAIVDPTQERFPVILEAVMNT